MLPDLRVLKSAVMTSPSSTHGGCGARDGWLLVLATEQDSGRGRGVACSVDDLSCVVSAPGSR